MRIFGLIALYAVALFLTGCLLLDRNFKSANKGDVLSSGDLLKQNTLTLTGKFQLAPAPDSLWTLPSWVKRPIGIVLYPDF
ncbi:MAG: hypothetical protein O9252_03455, partial [Algoriphagus sp.]|nr:hypothetical protein [Algoriphagus sp.]